MHRIARHIALVGVAAAATGGLAACGSDDSGSMDKGSMSTTMSSGSGKSVAGVGNGTDLAFVEQMIPHHRSAIAMARIAKEKSRRSEIQTLAGDIIGAQQSEIAELTQLRSKLVDGGVKAGSLNLDDSQMGMSMDASMLRGADPFDKAFIDMMTPHHRGAIAMARAELAKGENAQAKTIAQGIVTAQQREIRQMAAWRKAWYGKAQGGMSMG